MINERAEVTESGDVKFDFSSTQLDIPSDLEDVLLAWSKEHIPDSSLYEDPDDPSFGRQPLPGDNLHCTIKYGLTTPDIEVVQDLIDKSDVPSKIHLTFGSIGFFESEDYDVLIIEAESSEAVSIHELLTENLENEETFKEYHPHVTLKKKKKGELKSLKGNEIFKDIQITSDFFVFSSLTGEHSFVWL